MGEAPGMRALGETGRGVLARACLPCDCPIFSTREVRQMDGGVAIVWSSAALHSATRRGWHRAVTAVAPDVGPAACFNSGGEAAMEDPRDAADCGSAAAAAPRRRGLAVRAAEPIPRQLADTIRDAGNMAGSAEGMRAMARAIETKGGVDAILRESQSQQDRAPPAAAGGEAAATSAGAPSSETTVHKRKVQPRPPGPRTGASRRSRAARLSAKKRRSKARSSQAVADAAAPPPSADDADDSHGSQQATAAEDRGADHQGFNPDYLEAALAIAAQQSGMSKRQVRKRLQKSAANGHLASVAPHLLAAIPPDMRDTAIERLSRKK